jgi:membrane-associated protease RseP (regulator of RpoE activity)
MDISALSLADPRVRGRALWGDPPTASWHLPALLQSEIPAAQAGIQPGDVIVGMQGKPISDASALLAQIRKLPPETPIKMEVLRGDSFYAVDAVIGAQPQ